MEILFKDDIFYYGIKNDLLVRVLLNSHPTTDSKNIKHLGITDVLYHYIVNKSKKVYPVYYEHNNAFITKDFYGYTIYIINDYYIKDHTLINLNILDDGDTI